MQYPTVQFTHFDRTFMPDVAVDDDDPMVALRPDLFTDTPPTTSPPRRRRISKES